MGNSARTLNKLEISFKYDTNTLQYVGIRCHTSNGSKNLVHAQRFQRMPTYCLYVRHKLDVRYVLVMHRFSYVTRKLPMRLHTL